MGKPLFSAATSFVVPGAGVALRVSSDTLEPTVEGLTVGGVVARQANPPKASEAIAIQDETLLSPFIYPLARKTAIILARSPG
ncbi:hypothetical protein [Trichocoleus sp. FACHB-262]|uniref:hypothetical protein n=1 Tax=Trichocoleus sp. FACHB-262 TaxID=2692869 RepID=UPI001A7E6270|nr:hypothetical protein [Trichocoleus sp. FACHB-262]